MNILHVYRTYFPDPPGGLQEAIRQICLGTQRHGVQNKILTLSPNPSPSELIRPEAVVTRGRSWLAPASCDIGGGAEIRKFLDLSKQADVIHYHFPWPFADFMHMFAESGKPAVMTYHSDIVRQRFLKILYEPLMHRTLGSMFAIVATSPEYLETSPVLTDSRHAKRVYMIPLGIDERSYPEKGDAGALQRIGLSHAEPYFLFIGVLRYYKGLHYLVEAAARVKAKVVIAGSGPEGEALQEQAKELGLKNLIFAGQVTCEEKVALLQNCRALILPSHVRSEAFGMVLIEAGIYGRPMVSCQVNSGTSFANLHGETGFVVPPESPQALTDAMSDLLVNDDLARRMGFAARQRYEQLFSGEALGKAYTQLYLDAVSGINKN